MDNTIDTLQTSVRRLQKWNTVLLGAVVVLAIVVIADVTSESRVLRAQSIQLVSNEGQVLAELAQQDGYPGFYLKDNDGVNRAALFHAADGTGLYIMDSDGVTRVGIAQFAHGGGGVALHGPESKGAAVLYFKKEGSLRFFDPEGDITYQVTAHGPTDGENE
jgi:hypothetical protein